MGPTEKEILTSRLIDRSLRPLLHSGYSYEMQVMRNFAVDVVNDPDIMSTNAALTALTLSNVPRNGPIGTVKSWLL